MSSPITHPFSVATSCSTCQSTSTENDDTTCGCTCPNGTPTVFDGSAGTLCDTNTQVDCSACNTGYTISATPAAGSAQTCNVNTCTCPGGIATIVSGSGATLCDIVTEDCSSCNAGYTISATAVAGSAQTCVAKSCVATEVANSDHKTTGSISGTY